MRALSIAVVSPKFDCVTAELKSREWQVTPPELLGSPSSSCTPPSLYWLNLKDIDFETLKNNDRVVVNHLRGSQHLSNKSLLSYHLEVSETGRHILPLNWSAAYQNMGHLISIILLNTVYCCLKPVCCDKTNQLPSSAYDTIRSSKLILRLLRLDPDCSKLNSVILCGKLLDCIHSDMTVNILELLSEIKSLERLQPWRVVWGGLNDLWIVKPVGLSCGENIMVAQGLLHIIECVSSLDYKCVVQKYIEKPLLVRSPLQPRTAPRTRKFDIRQWILVTSVDPVVAIYGFSECYLRLSGEDYSLSPDKLGEARVHLCNHAIQKHSAGGGAGGDSSSENSRDPTAAGREEDESSRHQCDTMMTQSRFNEELLSLDIPQWRHSLSPYRDFVQPKVKAVCVAAVNSCRDKLHRVGQGFEWLGLDLMVALRDHDQGQGREEAHGVGEEDSSDAAGSAIVDVLLLEVNVSPDITRSTPVTSRLVQHAVPDLFSLLLDDGALNWAATAATATTATDSASRTSGVKSDTNSLPRWSDGKCGVAAVSGGTPRWEPWYCSAEHRNSAELRETVMQFAFRKRKAAAALSVATDTSVLNGSLSMGDYTPRKLELLQGVLRCLPQQQQGKGPKVEGDIAAAVGGATINSVDDEDDDDDEI